MCYFFFNDTATTEIYTLSLHDALPIYSKSGCPPSCNTTTTLPSKSIARPSKKSPVWCSRPPHGKPGHRAPARRTPRSEEHTSELQSRQYLVCRLLLEKKKNYTCT